MSEEAWLVTSVLPAIAHGLGAALGRFATSRIQHRPISALSFLSAPRRGPPEAEPRHHVRCPIKLP
jgi:hypothetical protein